MDPTGDRRRAFRVGLVLLAALLASPAFAQAAEWDQQKVATLSRDLRRALDALLADPGVTAEQSTAMQQRELNAAISTAREISRINDELSRRLAAAYDRDETQAFWDQIEELRGDIQAYARQSWLPEATRLRAQRCGDLLDQLAAFYSGEQ